MTSPVFDRLYCPQRSCKRRSDFRFKLQEHSEQKQHALLLGRLRARMKYVCNCYTLSLDPSTKKLPPLPIQKDFFLSSPPLTSSLSLSRIESLLLGVRATMKEEREMASPKLDGDHAMFLPQKESEDTFIDGHKCTKVIKGDFSK